MVKAKFKPLWRPNARTPARPVAQTLGADTVAAVHGPEHGAFCNSRHNSPRIYRDLNPRRHRNRADAAVLALEVHDAPTAIPLLSVCECEDRDLRSSQAAAEETARIARSRSPLTVAMSGALRSACA